MLLREIALKSGFMRIILFGEKVSDFAWKAWRVMFLVCAYFLLKGANDNYNDLNESLSEQLYSYLPRSFSVSSLPSAEWGEGEGRSCRPRACVYACACSLVCMCVCAPDSHALARPAPGEGRLTPPHLKRVRVCQEEDRTEQ